MAIIKKINKNNCSLGKLKKKQKLSQQKYSFHIKVGFYNPRLCTKNNKQQ